MSNLRLVSTCATVSGSDGGSSPGSPRAACDLSPLDLSVAATYIMELSTGVDGRCPHLLISV